LGGKRGGKRKKNRYAQGGEGTEKKEGVRKPSCLPSAVLVGGERKKKKKAKKKKRKEEERTNKEGKRQKTKDSLPHSRSNPLLPIKKKRERKKKE